MNELDNFARAIGMDSLLNYETVKHYNAEQLEKKRYDDAMRKYAHNAICHPQTNDSQSYKKCLKLFMFSL